MLLLLVLTPCGVMAMHAAWSVEDAVGAAHTAEDEDLYGLETLSAQDEGIGFSLLQTQSQMVHIQEFEQRVATLAGEAAREVEPQSSAGSSDVGVMRDSPVLSLDSWLRQELQSGARSGRPGNATDGSAFSLQEWFAQAMLEGSNGPRKSKTCLMFIQFTGLHLLGVDYFFMGNVTLGILQLVVLIVTCGVGGTIWALIRWIIVLTNCMQNRKTINSFGLNGTFGDPLDISTAHGVAAANLILILIPCCVVPILGVSVCFYFSRAKT